MNVSGGIRKVTDYRQGGRGSVPGTDIKNFLFAMMSITALGPPLLSIQCVSEILSRV